MKKVKADIKNLYKCKKTARKNFIWLLIYLVYFSNDVEIIQLPDILRLIFSCLDQFALYRLVSQIWVIV